MNPREHWLINQVRGKVIANIGFVGSGNKGVYLNEAFAKNNPQATIIPIDIAKTRVQELKIANSLVGSAKALPLKPKSCDGVVMGELVEHFFSIESLIKEASRTLKPNGKLFLTTPNPYQPFRFLKHWLLKGESKKSAVNAKEYLAAHDHCIFWEPISLVRMLNEYGLEVEKLTTKNFSIPYLFHDKNLDFWPFNHLSEYTCLVARKLA